MIMKSFLVKTSIFLAVLTAVFGVSVSVANAASPVLTLTYAGNDQVRIEVNGDVNMSVQLYYYSQNNSGSIVNVGSIGTTNSSGYFTTTVGRNAYGINPGSSVFVNVNNQQSASQTWPAITGGNVYLSQSNISLNTGSNTTVSISGGTGTYYVSSNSNSNVASYSINGSILTVNGLNNGNTTLTVCSASTGSSCATLYVSVYGYNNNFGSVTFSQNNLNVQAGQTQSVTVYGNSGSYYISGNSASGIASATISGSTLTISGIGNGSATFTVCSQNSNSSCGSLYVTVYSSYNNGNNYYPCTYNCYPNNNYYPTYPSSYYPYNYYYIYNYYNQSYPTGFYQTNSGSYGGGFILTSSR